MLAGSTIIICDFLPCLKEVERTEEEKKKSVELRVRTAFIVLRFGPFGGGWFVREKWTQHLKTLGATLTTLVANAPYFQYKQEIKDMTIQGQLGGQK